MTSPQKPDGAVQASEQSAPAANVEKKLNPAGKTNLEVDPVSSQVDTSLENKGQAEAAKKQREKEKKDATQTFKSTIIVSGVIVAVVGAIYAITRKLKEK